MAVLGGIVMNISDVEDQVGFVTDPVLPKPLLPESVFPVLHA
jgi:hypothetical protein